MIKVRVVLGVTVLSTGFLLLAVSVLSAIIPTSSTGTKLCGGGDMPPCSTDQTSTYISAVTVATSAFTPPGCSMSGGIVSCTETTSANTSTDLTGLVVGVLAILIGIVLLAKR